ncbi:MAG: hypothetical protein FRX48_00907 [Lasallia pustulata]|uniref:Uncharacterized protein n=1 Tax=Lasallia pustulata TaxID=136370 RepID=A0A5M8Q482_9LECA|nr:MAG: hypothetical protein FRX48_00907 [Lasallia pustulata]
MQSVIIALLPFVLRALCGVLARQDPGLQSIPATSQDPSTFWNQAVPELVGEPSQSNDPISSIYGARSVDLPFYRLYHGNITFFAPGQLNTATGNTDVWNSNSNGVIINNDNANQSACGIPDNAFIVSKVAIHPYFLKFAPLDRYCMQDVCISFWKEDGTSDMMLKVTDICSTDPSDPTYCATPASIKVDRSKVKIMAGLTDNDPSLQGDQYPEMTWWFFMKCWDDGLAQLAYNGSQNWFANPPLPNNLQWAQNTAMQQWQNNNAAYPTHGWDTYPNGGYNTERDNITSPPITDWVAGSEPSWQPLAGGLGWGKPRQGSTGQVYAGSSLGGSSASSVSSSSTSAIYAASGSSVVAPSVSSATSSTLAGDPGYSVSATSSFTSSAPSFSMSPSSTYSSPSAASTASPQSTSLPLTLPSDTTSAATTATADSSITNYAAVSATTTSSASTISSTDKVYGNVGGDDDDSDVCEV